MQNHGACKGSIDCGHNEGQRVIRDGPTTLGNMREPAIGVLDQPSATLSL